MATIDQAPELMFQHGHPHGYQRAARRDPRDFRRGTPDVDGPALQDAIDDLDGARGTIDILGHIGLDQDIDTKRAILVGDGVPGVSGGGGTDLEFAGTYGLYSSLEDNFGYAIDAMQLTGSAPDDMAQLANGQTLLDFTGQNYPRVGWIRLRNAEVGYLLDNGGTVPCYYGHFGRVDANYCHRAGRILRNDHWIGPGRYWRCNIGADVESTASKITFGGTTFETGDGSIGVRSAGDDVAFVGCYFEVVGGTPYQLLAGAGFHYDHGSGHYAGVPDLSAAPGRMAGSARYTDLALDGQFKHHRFTLDRVMHTGGDTVPSAGQLRVRMQPAANRVQHIRVRLAGGYVGTNNSANEQIMDYSYALWLDGNNTITVMAESLNMGANCDATHIAVAAVGSNNEVDLTIQNPLSVEWQDWACEIDVIGNYRNGFNIVNVAAEA